MSFTKCLHEDRELSCRVLVDKIEKENNYDKKKILLHDFITKAKSIRLVAQTYYFQRILKTFVNDDVRGIIKEMNVSDIPPKPRCDVAILTVKRRELDAARIALGISLTQEEDKFHPSGYRYWEVRRFGKRQRQDINFVLTMVGLDRRINCANACRTLFENYDVGICILVGIAAGVKDKVNLGDVIVAKAVWDYEGTRIEPEGPMKRPDVLNPRLRLLRDLEYYDPSQTGWLDFFSDRFLLMKKTIREIPPVDDDWKPNFDVKIMLSGDKLVADGSLVKMRKDYHEGIRALEMEAAGFAQTCEECGVPWLVFRGISDYGDPKTKDEKDSKTGLRKVWQSTAALSAVTAAINFIEHQYTIPKKNLL